MVAMVSPASHILVWLRSMMSLPDFGVIWQVVRPLSNDSQSARKLSTSLSFATLGVAFYSSEVRIIDFAYCGVLSDKEYAPEHQYMPLGVRLLQVRYMPPAQAVPTRDTLPKSWLKQ